MAKTAAEIVGEFVAQLRHAAREIDPREFVDLEDFLRVRNEMLTRADQIETRWKRNIN